MKFQLPKRCSSNPAVGGRPRLRRLLLLALSVSLFLGCATGGSGPAPDTTAPTGGSGPEGYGASTPLAEAVAATDTAVGESCIADLRSAMQAQLPPFPQAAPGKTPLVSSYYRECYRNAPGAVHSAGYLETGEYEVALHLFSPGPTPRGSLVVIHGYLAHTLQLATLIEAGLNDGYTVLAVELPGHALSRGERGAIGQFRDYGEILAAALEAAAPRLPRPWHAAGHSTGASAILIHLAEIGDPFDGVVFIAPLVKSKYYGLSRFGRFITRPFISSISTGYNEVLGVERMPLSWFDAQVTWNRRNDTYPVMERPLLVLQGSEDTVVAWRRNRRYLEAHFPNMEYELLQGASHVILKEEPEILASALSMILAHLEEQG